MRVVLKSKYHVLKKYIFFNSANSMIRIFPLKTEILAFFRRFIRTDKVLSPIDRVNGHFLPRHLASNLFMAWIPRRKSFDNYREENQSNNHRAISSPRTYEKYIYQPQWTFS